MDGNIPGGNFLGGSFPDTEIRINLPPGWCIYSYQPFIGFCFECLWEVNHSFSFIQISCCFFAVRKHDV